jgi:organic radical activating enzyme
MNKEIFQQAHSMHSVYDISGLLISWMFGNYCTYKCSYCNSDFNGGDHAYPAKEKVLEIFERFPKSTVMLLGGEPTFHPNFEDIVQGKPTTLNLQIFSNASRPIAFWERTVAYLDSIYLTYHIEYAIPLRFKDIAEVCRPKMARINLPMVPDRWNECVSAYDFLCSNNFKVSPKVVLENFGAASSKYSSKYTKEQLAWIDQQQATEFKNIIFYNNKQEIIGKSNPANLLAQNLTNFNGWLCESPKQNININASGQVYDTACGQKKLLGSIYNGFELSSESTICSQNFCWCYSDIHANKTNERTV